MKNRLMQLIRDNARAQARQPLRVEVKGDEAVLFLYDVIVSDDLWGGVKAEDFVKALRAITAPVIHIRINSPGGDVFAARAIEQAIREHPSKCLAHVDGYAASAASFVAVACDEVEIAKGGFFMIHNAWGIAIGNSEEMLSMADLLEKIDSTLADTYAEETGQKAENIARMMADETWISAQEAVDLGFADRIAEAAPKACAKWNLAAYAKAPKTQDEQEQEPEQPETENRERYERMARIIGDQRTADSRAA